MVSPARFQTSTVLLRMESALALVARNAHLAGSNLRSVRSFQTMNGQPQAAQLFTPPGQGNLALSLHQSIGLVGVKGLSAGRVRSLSGAANWVKGARKPNSRVKSDKIISILLLVPRSFPLPLSVRIGQIHLLADEDSVNGPAEGQDVVAQNQAQKEG